MAAKTHRRTGLSSYLQIWHKSGCANLKKKKKDLGISNTLCRKKKDSVGHAKVVQNSTFTKNRISSNSFLLPPYRKSRENYLNTLAFGGGMELLLYEF